MFKTEGEVELMGIAYSVNVLRKVFWPLAEISDIRVLASVWWLSVEGYETAAASTAEDVESVAATSASYSRMCAL